MAEKMNPEIKQQWVTALRSGEYEQGKGNLRIGDTFCCLGVLCDLAVKAGVAHAEEYATTWSYWTGGDTDDAELPEGVAAWAGLTGDRRTNPEVDGGSLLSEYNDDMGFTLAQIADLIEGQL